MFAETGAHRGDVGAKGGTRGLAARDDVVAPVEGCDAGGFVSVRQIVKEFEGRKSRVRALSGVDFSIQQGQRIALVGRSGSGKTTLLRTLNLLEEPTSGELCFSGRVLWRKIGSGKSVAPGAAELREHRKRVGMVFQRFELFPHLTALGNVAMGPRRVLKLPKRDARDLAMEQLSLVGLADRAKSHPHELSGGQQQRVAIARSLAMKPELMLFDEPTSALDPELVDEVLSVILDLAVRGMTMVVVTHEVAFARDCATRIAVFDKGVIVEEGSPEDVIERPKSERTAALLRRLRIS